MAREIPGLLFSWFDAHRRSFPWRENRDPYRIWVSEVMLQQTVAATVVPYFRSFMDRFPTVVALAKAPLDEVLHAWQGLGYYRRARMLHAAAQKLVEMGFEQIPNQPEILEQLPGLGRYTRNAILSQGFDRALPILEANTYRLFSRLFGLLDDPRSRKAEAWLWEAVATLVPTDRPGDFNQALMELGSLVCTPRQPSCLLCPLQLLCKAYFTGRQEEIPRVAPKAPPTPVQEVAIALANPAGEYLLLKRKKTGRWAGLWELPRGPINEGENPAGAASRVLWEIAGLKSSPMTQGIVIQHAITRFRVELACWVGRGTGGTPQPLPEHDAFEWVPPSKFGEFAVASPQKKLLQWIEKQPTFS